MISEELQTGKAGEYLVCADLIIKGFVAYPSEQGLPYDVVMDYNGRLYKIQVKTTRGLRTLSQRKTPTKSFVFNIKRRGKGNSKFTSEETCDFFALVILESREIGYILNKDIKNTMNFRCADIKGSYRDENINIVSTGRYLNEFKLENILCQLAK